MSAGIWSAASGAVARGMALDTAANNVANASTPGYRADRAVFRQTLSRAMDSTGTQSLRYAVVRTTEPNLAPGMTVSTGRSLDVALRQPEAFFMVKTAAGVRYTRAGNLMMGVDGSLTTKDGNPYLGPNQAPIKVDPTKSNIGIAADGQITSDGEAIGPRLGIVRFREVRGLEKEGDVLLRARPEAGPPLPTDSPLEPGVLELSNKHAVQSMTGMVQSSRDFDLLSRVIEAFSQVDKRAATDIIGR